MRGRDEPDLVVGVSGHVHIPPVTVEVCSQPRSEGVLQVWLRGTDEEFAASMSAARSTLMEQSEILQKGER